jgi:polyisoprenoid-binding protein YceI
MKSLRRCAPACCVVLTLLTIGSHLAISRVITLASHPAFRSGNTPDYQTYGRAVLNGTETERGTVLPVSYRIDASQSRFMVRAFSGGLLWFKGHDHFIAIRDFTGEAQLTPNAISPASLQMRIRADSLAETRDVFTEQQKQIINREMREIVLETAKYPEIIFKSTDVTVKLVGGQFEARIGGELTLHGMTRHILIPAQVTVSGDDLRARGSFTVRRSDYNVKATSALHGTIRVRDKLKFTFDIVAHQS